MRIRLGDEGVVGVQPKYEVEGETTNIREVLALDGSKGVVVVTDAKADFICCWFPSLTQRTLVGLVVQNVSHDAKIAEGEDVHERTEMRHIGKMLGIVFLADVSKAFVEENVALTFGIGPSYVKLVQVFHHSKQEDPRFRVFGVRYDVIHREAVDDAADGVLEVTERIKVSPKTDGMYRGENRVGCVGFHDTNESKSPSLVHNIYEIMY